ncbi:MAG: ATP-binding protein [Methylovulum sp.]|nr:ATP-binding protein [Methylovulum sp.]
MGFEWHETPLRQAHNLILVGGAGTGKTYLATGLGAAAIHQGKRLRFYKAVGLVIGPHYTPLRYSGNR